MKNIFILLFFFGSVSTGHTEPMETLVESPKSILKIEDFLPAQKKWSINTGVNILNNSIDGSHSGVYINEIGPGRYVFDRTSFSYDRESNGVSGYFSGAYGITDNISLSTTLNGQWVNVNFSTENGTNTSKNEYKFNGLGVGVSYQMYKISDFTVLFGGVNLKNGSVNSYSLGTSLNWIYDPVVLAFSLGVLDGISKEKFSSNYKVYTGSGKAIFAVNPEVNLNWGFSKDFVHSKGRYVNKNEWHSTTSMLIGCSINLMDNLTSTVNAKGGVGNNKNSVISLGLSYKI